MTPRKLTARIALAAVMVAAIAAIGIHFGTGARAPVQPPEKIVLALSSFMGNGLVFVAQANGYFAQEGLEVTIQPHPSGLSALQSAMGGNAGLAGVADTPLMFAAMGDRPPVIIASIASNITDQGIVSRRDRGIASIADLRGKRVGVTLRTSAHFLLDVTLVRNGVRPEEVVRVDLKPQNMADALSKGDVDAVATWWPYGKEAETALGANGIVFQGRQIHSYTFNLAGLHSYVDANPAAITRLLKALVRAERFVSEQPAVARAIVASAMKLAPEAVADAWPHYRLRVTLDQSLLALLEDGSRWAIRNRYVERAEVPNYLNFVHTGSLAAVRVEAVTVIR